MKSCINVNSKQNSAGRRLVEVTVNDYVLNEVNYLK